MKTDREMDRMNIVSELRYTDRQSMIDMLLNAAAEHQLPFEIETHSDAPEYAELLEGFRTKRPVVLTRVNSEREGIEPVSVNVHGADWVTADRCKFRVTLVGPEPRTLEVWTADVHGTVPAHGAIVTCSGCGEKYRVLYGSNFRCPCGAHTRITR